ncbi:MAG: hypothetical protein JXA20_02985 [Spirochaetes bacterium]|nr:hypothetical protein [Spirochaetota bacterium]
MKLLPYRRYELVTPYGEEEILAMIGDRFDRWKCLYTFFRSHRHPYEARVLGGETIELRRIIHYRNSFLPQVRMILRPDPCGRVRMDVTMRLHDVTIVFLALWVLGVLSYYVRMIENLISMLGTMPR